jgi:hypothetical protein
MLSLKDNLRKVPAGTLAQMYVELRDKRNEHEAKRKQFQADMDFLAGFIFEALDKAKQDGFRAGGNVVYKYELHTARCKDPQAFFDYVLETQNFDLIDKRANAKACQEFKDETGAPPIGVELVDILKLGVRPSVAPHRSLTNAT